MSHEQTPEKNEDAACTKRIFILCFNHFPASQATGTHAHPAYCAVDFGANPDKVWSEFTAGFIMCVADIITD
ncbi:hypothetical protein ES708_01387 [subsurface metagenome]